jgi:hypothetical protein
MKQLSQENNFELAKAKRKTNGHAASADPASKEISFTHPLPIGWLDRFQFQSYFHQDHGKKSVRNQHC